MIMVQLLSIIQTFGRSLRLDLWPWLGAGAVGAGVAGIFGMVRGGYDGISGFSSTNFGWLAFALIGGVVYCARQSDGRLLPWGFLRPVRAGALAFVLCTIAVCVTGLVFLPEQPLMVTLTTDAVGRAWVVAVPVIVIGLCVEAARSLGRVVTLGRSWRRRSRTSPPSD